MKLKIWMKSGLKLSNKRNKIWESKSLHGADSGPSSTKKPRNSLVIVKHNILNYYKDIPSFGRSLRKTITRLANKCLMQQLSNIKSK